MSAKIAQIAERNNFKTKKQRHETKESDFFRYF